MDKRNSYSVGKAAGFINQTPVDKAAGFINKPPVDKAVEKERPFRPHWHLAGFVFQYHIFSVGYMTHTISSLNNLKKTTVSISPSRVDSSPSWHFYADSV